MPTPNLHRLIYCSRSRLAGAEEALTAEVQGILMSSRRNNMRSGVTGALLFNAGCFGQVLEGTLPAIESTFERIQRDERHGDVTLLDLSPVAQRRFPNWSMAFVGRSVQHENLFAGIATTSGFEPGRLSGEHLLGLLRDLMLREEAAEALA